MVESSKATVKDYTKLLVTDEMVEYVLEKYGKNWNYDKEKGKEAEHDHLRVNKVVVQVSSDEDDSSEGFFGDEDVVLFNDVKYPLTDCHNIHHTKSKERPL
ncbi:hypothetical protein Tco_0464137 [Tanacetum coccineum]